MLEKSAHFDCSIYNISDVIPVVVVGIVSVEGGRYPHGVGGG